MKIWMTVLICPKKAMAPSMNREIICLVRIAEVITLIIIDLNYLDCCFNNMSLKDKGNDEVKRFNYPKAIQYYSQYVEDDHNDNKMAYTNLALCYFKLQDYQKTIEACESALMEDKQYAKAYYRLYLTYKEIPGKQYQVFINALLFTQYLSEDNTAAKDEAEKIIKEYKGRFTKRVKVENELQDYGKMESLFRISHLQQSKNGNQESIQALNQWESYFLNKEIDFSEKWEKIKSIILNNYNYGINLAYLFRNLTSSDINAQKQLLRLIIQAKQQFMEKNSELKIQTSSTSSNIFAGRQSIQSSIQIQPANLNDLHIKEIASNQKQMNEEIINNINLPTQPVQQQQKSPLQFINAEIEKLQIARDIFSSLSAIIQSILKYNGSKEDKQKWLKLLIFKQSKNIKLIKFSIPQKEQNIIYDLLVQNGLTQYVKILAPKFKKE